LYVGPAFGTGLTVSNGTRISPMAFLYDPATHAYGSDPGSRGL
jgi:hypothetical protein